MVKRVLVTGVAGYIGSHVLADLVSRFGSSLEIFGLDNHSSSRPTTNLELSDMYVTDLCNTAAITEVLGEIRPDFIVHLAGNRFARRSLTAPAGVYRDNVVGTMSLCLAIAESGIKPSVVFSSSCSVYGHPKSAAKEETSISPISPYGRSKAFAEGVLRDFSTAHGFHAISLRYFNVIGRRTPGLPDLGREGLIASAIAAHLSGQPLGIYGTNLPTRDGTCLRDYVSVADIARAHSFVIQKLLDSPRTDYDVYNIASGRTSSVLEVVSALGSALKTQIPTRALPASPADPVSVSADATRFGSEFGWLPSADLVEIFRDFDLSPYRDEFG
jgi:UDP-glucose-4-epimerase GalE